MRIKEEIRKILKGEIDDARTTMRRGTQILKKKQRKSVVEKEKLGENKEKGEANEIVTIVAEEIEVCG